MPGGNDVHSEQMSIADAKKWCAASPQCKGFTFSGPAGEAPESAVVHVMFKSAGDWAPGDGWHTYVQEDAAPAGPSHDFEYGAGYTCQVLCVPAIRANAIATERHSSCCFRPPLC